MSGTTIGIVLGMVLLFGLPVLVLLLRDRIESLLWRRRNPPEKLAADRLAYENRILHPDWDFYERHLQRPVPEALRELYSDHSLVVAQDLDCGEDEYISSFAPLDEQGLIETRPWLSFEAVSIATSDFGDPIYLRPGPSEPNAVYITCHDGGGTEQIAADVDAFLKRLRKYNRHT